jgi:hypothetical protein
MGATEVVTKVAESRLLTQVINVHFCEKSKAVTETRFEMKTIKMR